MDDKPLEPNPPATNPSSGLPATPPTSGEAQSLPNEDKLAVSDDIPSLASEGPAATGNTPPMPTNLETEEPLKSDTAPRPESSFNKTAGTPGELKESDSTTVTASKETATDVTHPTAQADKKKRMALLVAIIALALIAAAVYFFVVKKNKPAAPSSQAKNATTQTVTSADVTQTTSELDNTLSQVNDAKDFVSADLSDASLGL